MSLEEKLTRQQEWLNFAAQGLRAKGCFRGEQLQASPSNTHSPRGALCPWAEENFAFVFLDHSCPARVYRAGSIRVFPPPSQNRGCAFTFTTPPQEHAFFLYSIQCKLSLHLHLYKNTAKVLLIFIATTFLFVLCLCFLSQYLFRDMSAGKRPSNCTIPKMGCTC